MRLTNNSSTSTKSAVKVDLCANIIKSGKGEQYNLENQLFHFEKGIEIWQPHEAKFIAS